MTRLVVGVAGGTGFIGSACVGALSKRHEVRLIRSPRFQTEARSLIALREAIDPNDVDQYAETHLTDVDVLVNAAGLATATSTDLSSLMGANAVLPLFLTRAATLAGVTRVVHISSAAVQGPGELDEGERLEPDNRYALSKALGEALLRGAPAMEVIRYRPTSVQGPERDVTRTLMRLAESPLAAVAAPGDDPSPQIPRAHVADAVSLLVDLSERPPEVVLHPWGGATTRSVLIDLGRKEPRVVNRLAANQAVALAYAASRGMASVRAHARRFDMMMFGQPQADGWLSTRLEPIGDGWLRDCRREMLNAGRGGQR